MQGGGNSGAVRPPPPDRGLFDRVLGNAVAVFLARVVAGVATTALIAVAAHRLDDDAFGLVVSTMAAGFLVNAFITFGTDTLITRSIAAEDFDAATTARAALRFQLAAAASVTAIAAIAVGFGAPLAVLIEGASMLPLAVVTVSAAVIRGVQRMHHLLTTTLAGSLLSLAVLLVAFESVVDPTVPLIARAVGNTVVAALLWRIARRRLVQPAPQAGEGAAPSSWTNVVAVVRRALPFAGMVVLAAVGTQAGVLLVEFLDDEPTGGYGAALRLFEAARLVPAAVVAAFFPAMVTGLHHTDRYRRWQGLLGLYAVGACVGLVVLAGPINRLVFDEQPSGAALIRVLAVALMVSVARLLLSFEAIAEGRERVVLLSAAVGTAVLVIAGIALVGPFGAVGVAWAQTIGVVAAVAVLLFPHSTPKESEAVSSGS